MCPRGHERVATAFKPWNWGGTGKKGTVGYDHQPMGNYIGGSAYAMTQQIADGYLLVTERTFKRLSRGELEKLAFELGKLLREVRGTQPALDDTPAVQERNRRIQRLNTCRMMLQAYRQSHRT